jgi:hypothetical protein
VPYIGQDLQVAFPSYTNIDDISGSFDGVTTSFPLTVGGVAPVPAPLGSNQCLISVDGVVQRPDDTGTEGFRLSGGNIIFSSAPSIADDFFGIILAGADYVNVGANFPDGTLGAPSITFDQDNDTGYYRSGSGAVSFASNGVAAGTWSSAGVTAPALIPTGSSVPANGVYLPAANTVGVATNGTQRITIDSSGRLLVGTSTARDKFFNATYAPVLQIEGTTYPASMSSIVANGTVEPYLIFGRTRAGSIGGTTVVNSGDACGVVSFQGSDGTELVEAASIAAQVDGTPGANDMPGRLVFSTTADGGGSPSERLRITSAGLVGIGTSTPSYEFQVNAASDAVMSTSNSSSVTSGNRGTIAHLNSADSTCGMFRFAAVTDNVGTEIQFHTRPAAGSLTQTMTLDSAGRLGIGTTSPGVSLEVAGPTGDNLIATFRSGDATAANNAGGGFRSISSATATSRIAQVWLDADGANLSGGDYFIIQKNGNSGTVEFNQFASAAMTFKTGDTERARIDSSGRLLVGTTSVTTTASSSTNNLLAVESANNYLGVSFTANCNDSNGSYLVLKKSRGTSTGSTTVVQSGDEIGNIFFEATDGSASRSAAAIRAFVDATPGANDMPGRLVFSTTADGAGVPTERMRITNGGDLYFNCTVTTKTTAGFRIENSGLPSVSRGTDGTFMQFYHTGSGSLIGNIVNVSGTSTAYNTTSDYRLKENIAPLVGAINRINNLQVRRFNFIADPGQTVDGFIAHEAQDVVPEAVTGAKDAVDADGNPVYQGIDSSKLVPLLTAALQEAIGEIESLKVRVLTLESK